MKIKTYILTLLAIIFLIVGCSEDTLDDSGVGAITGTVVEAGTNEPIENARISTNPASSTVFTDENGEFLLSDIPADDYSVEARKEGFLSQFEGASVLTNTTVNVIFELEGETAGNKPPGTPSAVYPEDNAIDVPPSVTFKWNATDPEEDDLTYQLEIRNDSDEEIFLIEDIEDTTYTVEGLEYDQKYFWQVSASDDINSEILSPLYSFRTMAIPVDSRILFTRMINGNSVIFAKGPEGEEFQLTSSANNSFRPRKNNSSDKIAFLRIVGTQTQLFTMDPDGSEKKQVTSNYPVKAFNMDQVDFAWADDGTSLLYPSFGTLYMVDVTGGGTTEIFQTQNGDFITEVDVSEDNQTIALITNNSNGYDADLFTINFDGEIKQRILNNVEGALGGLDLSVQGDKLLYTYDSSGFRNDSYRRLDSDLFIYNFSSRQFENYSHEKPEGTNDLDPRFSPNEAEVIFVNTSNDGISSRDIYTLVLEGVGEDTENRVLLIENAFMPDWE
ncbi:carboxypeptidase regulatory-like domain-containing protein [Salinimicrobium terrae]|uniref:carboxypeptidase regulatory-like domain-containing protein n=1 Tax=Salinimicrobium terrae TaxID=470866 RepID=UPI00048D111C|nr:carboxypeptidase regulatory-like domain-containing protein [Salinimicrobium terrae]